MVSEDKGSSFLCLDYKRMAGEKMLTNYAQIGKGELIQILGIQQDEEKIQKIDIQNGKTVKQYKINREREKYGTKKRLSTAPLLLWIYLHFLSPEDETGKVFMIRISDIVRDTGFTYKTCKAAIQTLAKENYIELSEFVQGYFTIQLCNYKNYFLGRKKGGTGYVELTKDHFSHLLEIAHQRKGRKNSTIYRNGILNTLRLILRTYMLSEQSEKEFRKRNRVSKKFFKSIEQLKKYLPRYFCNKTTKRIMDAAVNDLAEFGIYLQEKNGELLFSPRNDISGAAERKETMETYTDMLSMHLSEIERILDNYTSKTTSLTDKYSNILPALIEKYNIKGPANNYVRPAFAISTLAQLAVEYSLQAVKKSLSLVFSDYALHGVQIQNPAGLVRQLIRNNI